MDDRLEALLLTLNARTVSGKLDWKEHEKGYELVLPHGRIWIAYDKDDDHDEFYELRVFRTDGELADKERYWSGNGFFLLSDLVVLIDRRLRKIDETLDGIFSDLGGEVKAANEIADEYDPFSDE